MPENGSESNFSAFCSLYSTEMLMLYMLSGSRSRAHIHQATSSGQTANYDCHSTRAQDRLKSCYKEMRHNKTTTFF